MSKIYHMYVTWQNGRLGLGSGQTGHGSKQIIFKQINQDAGRVGFTRIFQKKNFFFQLQK